jgi:hypothetical protein
MAEDFQLKPITLDGVPAAIRRAEHYRLLGQPEQAESICLDVLEVDPDNQQALVVALLAVCDQFGGHSGLGARSAEEYLERITGEYDRHYYAGIVSERQARAALARGGGQDFAYHSLREAMDWFAKAAAMRPARNDDAILRWNACVRTVRRHTLRPRPDEGELGLE